MNTQLVTVNNGIASTTSLIVAEAFGRRHTHVLRTLNKLSIGRPKLGLSESEYFDDSGKSNKMYNLSERQALIAMPFIGGKNAIDGQEKLVDAFIFLRDKSKGIYENDTLYIDHESRLSRLEQQLIAAPKAVLYVDTAHEQYAHTIKTAIKSNGKHGISKNCLYDKCRSIPGVIKNKLINDFIELGNIFTLMTKINGSRRSSLVYYWRK
jgi:Rha family phage regulatory protein